MTVIAKGHSYRDRQTNREYLVTEMPYKRNWLNMLLCRNTRMVKVREYPLAMRGLKEETFPGV